MGVVGWVWVGGGLTGGLGGGAGREEARERGEGGIEKGGEGDVHVLAHACVRVRGCACE